MLPAMRRLWPLVVLLSLFLLDVAALAAGPDPGPLPVTKADASWGDDGAPVTIIGFSDLQCPFCDRVLDTLDELRQDYGPKKIRIVHKDFPLAFHKQAHDAAQVGSAIQTLEGDDAFFDYQAKILEALKNQVDPLDLAHDLGLDDAKIELLVKSGKPKKKVDADITLGKAAGVQGTPAFFVNGVFMSGAQPKDKFAAVIDEQLAAAAALRKKGVAANELSLALTKENFAAEAGKPGATVWKVPVGKSPRLGPDTALVTWVVFSEYQCPYCAKLMPTVTALRAKYGNQLRVVFKHNPLPFHDRADEAAELAAEAFAQKGDAGFWRATDKLFASASSLADDDLKRIAGEVSLDPTATMAAIQDRKHKETIEADQLLARDLQARGTPASFINGRLINGAGDAAKFEEYINKEIAKAKKLIAKGIPRGRLYDHIMKTAKGPPPPPKKTIPAIDDKTPVKGKKTAKVTVQVFVDFESGFWLSSVPIMNRLEKEYAGKLRFAFRHRPLPFHTNALLAHEAAAEAFAQKGNVAFWKMYDHIAADPHALDRTTLLAHAKKIGLDTQAIEAAWHDRRHAARIDADIELAKDRGISSVPAFLINGYYQSGAKSYLELKKIVELALDER